MLSSLLVQAYASMLLQWSVFYKTDQFKRSLFKRYSHLISDTVHFHIFCSKREVTVNKFVNNKFSDFYCDFQTALCGCVVLDWTRVHSAVFLTVRPQCSMQAEERRTGLRPDALFEPCSQYLQYRARCAGFLLLCADPETSPPGFCLELNHYY